MSTSQTEQVGAKTVTYFRKPERSFWQIWNMSFGFLGIQFGWGLQMANMSAIYEYLGARADQIPILWLAAPLTGLLIQPLIGHASDHTWGRLGRRRPYFLAGAILSSLMLILMPNASALWMAAGMLWILDASINVSMEPFRAFVADILPEGQRTSGFAMQSLFIGLGASFSSALPYILTNFFHMQQKVGDTRAVPTVVRISFYVGAVGFHRRGALDHHDHQGISAAGYGSLSASQERRRLVSPPMRGRSLRPSPRCPTPCASSAPCNCCTWLGLFCMWLYFPVAVAHNVFGANDTSSPLYQAGVEWGGNCFAIYSIVCFAFSFALPSLARKLGRKEHAYGLPDLRRAGLDVGGRHSQQVCPAADHGGRWHCLGQYIVHALRSTGGFSAAGDGQAFTWGSSISSSSRRRFWHRCSSAGS